MKKILFILISLFVSTAVFSNNSLSAYFSYAPFYSERNGTYIETYLAVVGNSVVFKKNKNDMYQASIEITMLFKNGDDIKEFRKYNLTSPEVEDTTENFPNFIDLQRITIPNGNYNFELIISDNNNDSLQNFTLSDIITVDYQANDICFSGIELIDKYTKTKKQNILSKSGFDIIPYVSNFYPKDMERISFYTEMYNVNKVLEDSSDFLINYYIETYHSKKALNDFNRFEKQKVSSVNILFKKIPIKELPSGNYNLVVDVRDRNNHLLKTKKIFFQRSNPGIEFNPLDLDAVDVNGTFANKMTNINQLADYISSLYFISDATEQNFEKHQLKAANIKLMQQFFFNFWSKRNNSAPEQEWIIYKKQVDLVNKSYSSQIRRGYETDRGRVYLQYGTPNSIFESKHEPNAYPYEIWHYYKIDDQTNKKFVFYNSKIVGDDFVLLHSDAKGEIVNKNWKNFLNKRSSITNGSDQRNNKDHFGGRYDDEYKTH
ncbi:MAG: GWxTD domain-containing protein [Bacteroidetes bacterium]|nr:GWxTD domain-containing protein [Bacteroidota bacterium]